LPESIRRPDTSVNGPWVALGLWNGAAPGGRRVVEYVS